MDILREMPRAVKTLELTAETLSHFTTDCVRKQEIPMKRWRAILEYSVELYDLGDVHAIDATGVDRIQASQHYAKRTDYTFEAVKTSLLIDCETSVILDIHCSMKQPHDTPIGWQVLMRYLDALSAVAAHECYDWETSPKVASRRYQPGGQMRKQYLRGHARNLLVDEPTYHLRSNAESVFFGLRRR